MAHLPVPAAVPLVRDPPCGRRCRGASITEVAVTLALVGTLLGVGVGDMGSWLVAGRAGDLANTVLFDLYLARSEAVKRNGRVVLCKSADGQACSQAGGWEQGLIVFHDLNDNARRDASEPLLHQEPPLPDGWRLTGNRHVRDYVGYGAQGMTRMESGAFQAGTLTLCRAAGGRVEARQIVVSASGRPRVQRAELATC